MLIFGEWHLHRLLVGYAAHYSHGTEGLPLGSWFISYNPDNRSML